MWIQSLESRNFRNLVDGRIQLESGLNWLYGPNGQGKTNCLEMAYFALTSKSFRTHLLSELLCNRKEDALVSARLMKGDHQYNFGCEVIKGRVNRSLGGKPCKAMDFFKLGAVISFTARSKNLVDGSPDDRRRFMDRMVSYLDPDHLNTLGRYRKVHGQLRQILAKRDQNLSLYKSFKSTILPTARKIVEQRRHFLDRIRERAGEIYRDIFQGQGELEFEYQCRNDQKSQDYERRLMDCSATEILHGRSMMGPHLDDLSLYISDHRARRYASSGQVRAIVLSMKMAVREAYQQRFGSYPILLLDDIDAEIDPERLNRLINYVSPNGQTLISTSKYDTMRAHLVGCVHVVNAGRIDPERINE